MSEEKGNIFLTLNSLNVNEHVEKRKQETLSYRIFHGLGHGKQ